MRDQLIATKNQDETEGSTSEPNLEWIEAGTETWKDLNVFVFGKNGIHFFFPPYQVDCYAAGSHFAEVPYKMLKLLMKGEYVGLLDIYY